MITKEYKCEILTPIIMSGADQTRAELRASSIKGMLRWWWRALHPTEDSKQLREKEFELFGGVFGEKQRRSQVQVWLRGVDELMPGPINNYVAFSAAAVKYLLYGAGVHGRGETPRKAFTPGQSFDLLVRVPTDLEEDIHRTMSAMLTYGGLGLKSKNGFGQLYCSDTTSDLPQESGQNSNYPHLENFSKFEVATTYEKASEAHVKICDLYYKSKNPIQADRGREIQYLSTASDKNLFAGHIPSEFGLDRKAKPVQLYVRREGDKYRAGILAFPYEVPTLNPKDGKSHPRVVNEFMDNVRHNNGNK